MTDANGTRISRTSAEDSQSGSKASDQSGNSVNSSLGSQFGKRPPLRIPSSRFAPQSPTSPSRSAQLGSKPGNKPGDKPGDSTSNSHKIGSTHSKTTSEAASKPRTRYRSREDASTQRPRRSRRRLFGTVPDRTKRKSSHRTRALKAKTEATVEASTEVKTTAKTGPKLRSKAEAKANVKVSRPNQKRRLQPPAKSTAQKPASRATGRALTKTAETRRPSLPNTSYPGRVPPARSIVRKRRRSSKSTKLLRTGLKFLICGLGIAVFGGTLIKAWPNQSAQPEVTETVVTEPIPVAKTFPLALGLELSELKSSLQELPNLYPNLTPKVFYIDVDTSRYVSVEGSETIAAASTIKLPILLAFFEEVDAGRIDPNQTLAIQQQDIAEGSGDMQISPPGTQFTALEVASQMIINSDNTATNMMIGLLGGREILNDWFQTKGLEKTVLNAPLPDLEGTNTTSAKDLVHTMLLISQGEELEMRSRDRILNILNRTYNKNLLSLGPEEQGALTYNKTGDIASVLGDVALVDLPNGKRYVIAALVERPTNDGRALELLRRISGQTYEEAAKAIQPAVTPLGNPDGEEIETSSPASGTQSAPPENQPSSEQSLENQPTETQPTEVQPVEVQPVEEEPYPSANPQDRPRPNTSNTSEVNTTQGN